MLHFVKLSSSYGTRTTYPAHMDVLPKHTVSTYHPASLQSLDSRVAESRQDGRHGVEVPQIVTVLQGPRRYSSGGGAAVGVGQQRGWGV